MFERTRPPQRLVIEDAARRRATPSCTDARRDSGRPNCRRPHARRPGRDVSAEADSWRRTDRPRWHLSASGGVVRPLLDVSRAELRDYLKARARRGSMTSRTAIEEPPESRSAPGDPGIDRRLRSRYHWFHRQRGRAGPRGRAVAGRARGRPVTGAGERDAHGLEIDAAALAERARTGAAPAPAQRPSDVAGVREVAWSTWNLAADIPAGLSGGADVPGGRVELRRGKLVLLRKR